MEIAQKFCDYEMYLLFSKSVSDETMSLHTNKFIEIIKTGGESGELDKWGKRKLAYPIKGESEGIYALLKFRSIGSVPAEIRRISQITEDILRILIIKKEF